MGITFDIEQQRFQFDFEHDGMSNLITLTGSGYQVEAFGKCFYYGYEFEAVKNEAGYNRFVLTIKQWVERTGAIDIISKAVNIPEIVKLMKRVVPEFKSKNSRFEIYDK